MWSALNHHGDNLTTDLTYGHGTISTFSPVKGSEWIWAKLGFSINKAKWIMSVMGGGWIGELEGVLTILNN